MTSAAISTEFTVVTIIFFMAGETIRGCAFEDIIDVALFTFDVDVFTFEFERREIVIELGGLPGSRGVT